LYGKNGPVFGGEWAKAKAKIILCEGIKSESVSLRRQLGMGGYIENAIKYVIEVQPDGEPPFRTEATAKTYGIQWPTTGSVNVEYNTKSHKARIITEGDRHFVPKPAPNAKAEQRRRALDG
jgi:hypothetical protein